MKFNLNKLMILVYCFCFSFALADPINVKGLGKDKLYNLLKSNQLNDEEIKFVKDTIEGKNDIEAVDFYHGMVPISDDFQLDTDNSDNNPVLYITVDGESRVSVEVCADPDYSSWYWEECYFGVQSSDGTFGTDFYSCNETQSWNCVNVDLDPGDYQIKYYDTYGDGYISTRVDGTTLGFVYAGSADEVMYGDVWTVSPPSCDDVTACNYPSSTENCTYPVDNCTACDGSDLGGVDACGVCGGDGWACNPENILNGPAPAGATSGTLYDSGGASGNYPNSQQAAYFIDVTTGVVVVDVVSLDLENCCDTLWLCDGDGAPSVSPWYGSGDCTRISSLDTVASTTSSATVYFESDGSVTYGGFQLSWSQQFAGCTDSSACAGYDASATYDNGSCQYNDAIGVCGGSCTADADSDTVCDDVDDCVGSYDSCGICNGADASQDCAGTCSGTFAQGSFTLDISYADGNTQEEVYVLSASGSNWSVSNCSNYNGEGSLDTSVSFSADCDLTSDFWAGAVSLTLSVSDLAAGLGSVSLSGTGLSVTLDGAVDLANSTGNTLIGDTSVATVGGALADNCGNCDFDTSNDCVQDCAGQWGGTASLDDCGLCNGGNTTQDCLGVCSGTLSDGSFQLDISYASDDVANEDELYALTASGSNWSVSNCSNFTGSSGSALTFTADCDLTSDFWSGAVSMALGVSDQAAGTGSISLTGNGLSVTLDGSVDLANSTALTLIGSTSAASVGGAVVDNCDVCDGDGTSCVQGCMDSTACNYNPGAGVPGDCYTIDACGQCGGLDANLDCAGVCSGSLSEGTWTNGNPGSQDPTLPPYLYGSANDGSWTLSDCYYTPGSGVNVFSDDGTLVDITAEYSTGECLFTSSVFTGQVAISTVSSHNTSDYSLTSIPSFTLSGGSVFSFSSSGTSAGVDANGSLTGDLPGGAIGGSPDFDNDGLCDDVDPDDDNDGLEPTTDGITGDCDDNDANVGLCTYSSCDDWGGQGCLWQDGTVALWWEGWWNCPQNGGQVCGLAEVNFEVDTNNSDEAANIGGVSVFGSYDGWDQQYDAMSDADGDGVYTLTMYFDVDYHWNQWTDDAPDPYEIKFFDTATGVEENLLDFGTTVQGSDDWGNYYEYLNASCAPVTDYYSYANRQFSITADDINTSQTIKACFGSCNETCLSGCTDATSCTYTADDNLDENLAGQVNYDSDDGSCLFTDNCGFCGGGDANFDCAGECSGSLSDGTLLEVPGISLSGVADDNSWSLSDCSISSSTVTDVNAFVQNIVTDYSCQLSSGVFNGSVVATTDQNVFTGSSTPAGFLFNFSLSSGSSFNLSTTSLISGYSDTGIAGALSSSTDTADGFPDVFGLVGTGVDGFGTDCNSECGGSAFVDDCGVCSGGSTIFSAGSFTLEPNSSGDDWNLTASADDGSWSLGNCSNYNGSGAPDDNLVFTADCDVTSVAFSGTVALALTLSDVADDGSATGSVSLSAANFSATASGTVADSSTFPTLNGLLTAFGEFPNEDNLGCGCFNAAPLSYFVDSDGDGLGAQGTSSELYCLVSDDCDNVAGGCSYSTIPHTYTPAVDEVVGGCTSSDTFYDDYGDGCDYYNSYPWYCSYTWWYDGSANGDPREECCGCGGGTNVDPVAAVPESYEYHWVLDDTDADDACTSNSHDCAGVCDGPGSTATTDGTCCNSGNIDCTGTCEGALFNTNYDGTGNDCNGVCGGDAQALSFGWTSNGSYDYETSWSLAASDSTVVATGSGSSVSAVEGCFLTGASYSLSMCDSSGDGWDGSVLSIGDEDYFGSYLELEAGECTTTEFNLAGDGGCNVVEATNYDAAASWDDGSCLWDNPAPANFAISGEDSPEDHPDEIGFRISWDSVPRADRYVLEFYDETPQPEPGDVCDYFTSGGGGLIDCTGQNCIYDYWNGDNECDNYTSWSFDCEELGWDGGDCCTDELTQTTDPDGLCYDDPSISSCYEDGSYLGSCGAHEDCPEGQYCWASGTYHYCGSNTSFYDCCYYGDSIDTDCDGDGDRDDCPQDCSVVASTVGNDDVIKDNTLFQLNKVNPISDLLESIDLLSEESVQEAMNNYGNKSREAKIVYNAYLGAMYKDSAPSSSSQYELVREPIGWTVIDSNAESPYWFSGFEYNQTVSFVISTVTNMGTGTSTAEVSATTPVLPDVNDLAVTPGAQVVDDWEFANLSWTYPTFAPLPYPDCNGTLAFIGDGRCDTSNNNPECGWDGGDCCADTCETDGAASGSTQYDCDGDGAQGDNNNDGCWDSCYDPDSACGNGIPTCNDDYQFGVIVSDCKYFSNTVQVAWNTGCTGAIYLDGLPYISNTDYYSSPVYVTGLDPSTEYLLEFVVQDETVASETETTSDENCDEEVENCPSSNLNWIADGYCDTSTNNLNCAWDGGDCCPGDCIDETYSCDTWGGDCSDCLDPGSADFDVDGECYVPPCTGVEVTLSSVSYNDGGYDSELSWTIFDSAGAVLLSMSSYTSLPYEGCLASLPDGWYVQLNDSANDGWDGQLLTIGDQSFTLSPSSNDPGEICYDSSATVIDCPTDPNAAQSCYDSYVGSCGTHEDCGPGNYCYYSSWSGSHSCYSNTGFYDCCYYNDSIDTDCDGDRDRDDCPQDCSFAASVVGFKVPQSHHTSVENNLDKPEADGSSEGYGVLTDYQYRLLSGDNPNIQDYRAAVGFNIYRQAADDTWLLEGSTTATTAYQITTNPIGCYAVSAYDNEPAFESGLSNVVCLDAPACPIAGDVTQDGLVNISDIVFLVNAILGSGLDAGCADMNEDGLTNVSDVVALVNIILNARTLSANDASESVLLISDTSLKLESDGFVQGVQITLSHDLGFEIELSDAYVSEYKTSNNETTLILVSDGSHSITDIATFDGEIVVESIHVVNQSGDVTVEEAIEVGSFEVKVTGPNPFNPSTQLNIVVPEAGFVSVNVYNILGQKVATLVDGYLEATPGYMVNFNASHLASGVYLVRAVTANEVSTQKLMLLK